MITGRVLPVLSVSALAVAAFTSLQSIRVIYHQSKSGAARSHFYEDADGKGTPESIAEFSNRRCKLAALTFSLLAAASFTVAAFLHLVVHPNIGPAFLYIWISVAAWVLVVVQGVVLLRCQTPVQSFDLAMVLTWLSLGCTAALLGSCFSLPRRPNVFYHEIPVIAEYSVSAWKRYTWNWTLPLLDLANKKGHFSEKDIPATPYVTRAETLVPALHMAKSPQSLTKALLWQHKRRIIVLWALAAGRCVVGAVPFWAMLQMIRILEATMTAGERFNSKSSLWPLVFLFGISSALEQYIHNWALWYLMGELVVPVRSQLCALVYEKSLRRKVVTVIEREKKQENTDGDNSSLKSPKNSTTSTQVDAVNLMGVDTDRIAQIARSQYFFVQSLTKFAIYFTFLIDLMGWAPLVVALLTWSLTVPINLFGAKYFAAGQKTLMTLRDEKISTITEAVHGIRQIKLSASEAQWEQRIVGQRVKELKQLRKLFAADTLLFLSWICSPIILAGVSFSAYALIHGDLPASVAFVGLGIFRSLEVALSILPQLVTALINASISIQRIGRYLGTEDIEPHVQSDGDSISFVDATISWPEGNDENPLAMGFSLQNLTITFPSGSLTLVHGASGSGKSLLLASILGEAELRNGSITRPKTMPISERNDAAAQPGNWVIAGAIAYVAQTPWLENATIRDNILFGLPMIKTRYEAVLDACCLRDDLNVLETGDETDLGPNGVNLSGGQQWRVALARAVYSRAEILVLDDIFSAVDVHVGRAIYDDCLTGDICKDRTRILATHHVTMARQRADFLLELKDGKVTSGANTDHTENSAERIEPKLDGYKQAPVSELKEPRGASQPFVQEEARSEGKVTNHVYGTYMNSAGGGPYWVMCIAIFVAFEATVVGQGWWLRLWTSQESTTDKSSGQHSIATPSITQELLIPNLAPSDTKGNMTLYLSIYIALCVSGGVIGVVRVVWTFIMSLRASRTMFENLLLTIFRCPIQWFDTVPVGRILNRFSADFETIDMALHMDFTMLLWRFLSLTGVCVAAAYASVYMIPFAAILAIMGWFMSKRYLVAARSMRRLESTTKSPVFELFNVTQAGISTIRAFERPSIYIDRMRGHLDRWSSASLQNWAFGRWFGCRLSLLGAMFTTLVGVAVILQPSLDAALLGFALSFATEFGVNLLETLNRHAALELDMNATERVIEYSELEMETQSGATPPAAWPTSGVVQFDNVVVGYSESLPPVLKGISFTIQARERMGIVGRTGAGKSTLAMALFRFLEVRSGAISIDGIDVSTATLQGLRSRLAVIPQDPILFAGTIRSNLDPDGRHTDSELVESLSRIYPGATVQTSQSASQGSSSDAVFHDLETPVSRGGGNLSHGQRQLLCIARALVTAPKVIVFDEATSAIDSATDAHIQRTIRQEFPNSTLIVIAHRLSTVADFDRLLVMKDGVIAEMGNPRDLWSNTESVFRSMCDVSTEHRELKSRFAA